MEAPAQVSESAELLRPAAAGVNNRLKIPLGVTASGGIRLDTIDRQRRQLAGDRPRRHRLEIVMQIAEGDFFVKPQAAGSD
jgi:hypothetical protein